MTKIKKITVISAQMDCLMCPTIFIGKTTEAWTVYARYRWGQLSVRLDPRDPAPNDGAAGRWILEIQLDPNGLDGCISYDTLREITSELVEWPAELTQKNYDEGEESSWPNL